MTYTYVELEEALKEVEIIMQSLHRMGSYYGIKFLEDETKYRQQYEKETTRFIDEWGVCERLSKVRRILSDKFDTSLGEDDMEDLERSFEKIKYWKSPGDKP
ncbi:MAG: hypothetical protein N3B21_14060 [Clostridia bacterium]|nr:hypothetical protein [Clostridia bacterium]